VAGGGPDRDQRDDEKTQHPTLRVSLRRRYSSAPSLRRENRSGRAGA